MILFNHSTDGEYVQKAAEHFATGQFRFSHDSLRNDTIKKSLLDDVRNETLGVRRSPRAWSFADKQQFQKIFVINLASRSDRRDSTARAASFTGIELEFVDAVSEGTYFDQTTRCANRSSRSKITSAIHHNAQTSWHWKLAITYDCSQNDRRAEYSDRSHFRG